MIVELDVFPPTGYGSKLALKTYCRLLFLPGGGCCGNQTQSLYHSSGNVVGPASPLLLELEVEVVEVEVVCCWFVLEDVELDEDEDEEKVGVDGIMEVAPPGE